MERRREIQRRREPRGEEGDELPSCSGVMEGAGHYSEQEEQPSGISERRNGMICLKTGSLFTAWSRKIACNGPDPDAGGPKQDGGNGRNG